MEGAGEGVVPARQGSDGGGLPAMAAATRSSVWALVGRKAWSGRWLLRYDDGKEELVLLPDPDVEILPRGGAWAEGCCDQQGGGGSAAG
jgi:hypothetical protein